MLCIRHRWSAKDENVTALSRPKLPPTSPSCQGLSGAHLFSNQLLQPNWQGEIFFPPQRHVLQSEHCEVDNCVLFSLIKSLGALE